jgi:adenylate cyclase
VKQIGRELGVRYVLEGSLRKSGNRMRVTVEGETGRHVWAERYDRELADIFTVQDEITEAVTVAIAPAIAAAEQQRALRKPPDSLDAWAGYQRGLWHLSKASAEDNALAEKFFQRAIDRDPIFAAGYTGLATAVVRAGTLFHKRDVANALSAAEALARRAVALDGGDTEARARLAIMLAARGDRQGAQTEAERALTISPNLADAHGALGVVLTFSGRPQEGACGA